MWMMKNSTLDTENLAKSTSLPDPFCSPVCQYSIGSLITPRHSTTLTVSDVLVAPSVDQVICHLLLHELLERLVRQPVSWGYFVCLGPVTKPNADCNRNSGRDLFFPGLHVRILRCNIWFTTKTMAKNERFSSGVTGLGPVCAACTCVPCYTTGFAAFRLKTTKRHRPSFAFRIDPLNYSLMKSFQELSNHGSSWLLY